MQNRRKMRCKQRSNNKFSSLIQAGAKGYQNLQWHSYSFKKKHSKEKLLKKLSQKSFPKQFKVSLKRGKKKDQKEKRQDNNKKTQERKWTYKNKHPN
jgi:hypothetical protein